MSAFTDSVTSQLAEKMQTNLERCATRRDLATLIVDALLEAGVDLRSEPTLEDMKAILVRACRVARDAEAALCSCAVTS